MASVRVRILAARGTTGFTGFARFVRTSLRERPQANMMCTHQMSQAPLGPASAKCAVGTLRRATRSVARFYDSRLARAGLTATQFSILRALVSRTGPVPLSRLAEELVLERTSLYRALEPLYRQHLIAFGAAGDRRAKRVALTREGERHFGRALPHWREAQEAFLEHFGRSTWRTLASQLGEIVATARAISEASG